MTLELQLEDYLEGWQLRVKCEHCGHGCYETPEDLLARPDTHARMYLDEVEKLLVCKECKQRKAKITPLLQRPQHHFVGGLA